MSRAAQASGAALSVRERTRALVESVPVWAWLAGLVLVSAVVRIALSRRSPAPWIFVDEIIYSELAKSFAETGRLSIRDEATTAYGFVYPVLISPAYAIFDNLPHAYAAAKAINSVVMSLAAIPAYLLARRLLSPLLSFVSAVLAVAVPSMVYTGTLMTENAFYPAFLFAVLAIVLMLERPTTFRQFAALLAIAFAFFIRVQAVALVAVLITAILLYILLESRADREKLDVRGLLRRLDTYRTTWAVLGAGLLLVVGVQAIRGREASEIIGAYRAAGDVDYSVGEVARWFLYHVAGLDLYLGVIPFAAFLLVVGVALWRSETSQRARIFAAVALPTVFWVTLLVATFASQPSIERIQERNLFYLAPLFFIALLLWVSRGLPRPWPLAAVAAATAAALPGVIPYTELIGPPAVSDTLALLPLWDLQDSVITIGQVAAVVVVIAIAMGLVFLLLPRRLAFVLPTLLLALFIVMSEPIASRIQTASVGSLFSGIRVEREWIDEAVPAGSSVALVWSGNTSERAIWDNEFFNRAAGPVYHVSAPLPGNLPETAVEPDAQTGVLVRSDGTVVEAEYALSDGSFPLGGEPIARDPGVGMTLYRVDGPLALSALIDGLYPNDTWSGPELTYTRLGCDGGILTVSVTSDPVLFTRPQTVTAAVGGMVVAETRVAPRAADHPLVVPLQSANGRCEVTFAITPTAVPAEVVGGGDTRELGIHFAAFQYNP